AIVVETLSADEHQPRRLLGMLALERLALTEQVGVEAAAETAVAGQHDQVDALLLAAGEQRMRLLGEARGDGGEPLRQLRGIRSRAPRRILRPPQARGSHHLHGPGDLLRGSDGADPLAEVLETGHQAAKRVSNSFRAASIFETTSSLSSRFS